ncbi:MAG: hypothetical protein AAB365_00205 [Patescibacteria group bacterium]
MKSLVVCIIAIPLILACNGCDVQTGEPPPPPMTNAVAHASSNASPNRVGDGVVPNMVSMRILLTTELSKNASIIPLGRGLYFFKASDDDRFEPVFAYLREHTNLVPVIVFSAQENHSSVWYTGDHMIDLKYFPENLNISNGVFAVFRDR